MRVCYLASPIDNVPGETAGLVNKMRNEALGLMHAAGTVVYDPASAWYVGKGQYAPDERVWVVNECAMEVADSLLALLPSEASSVGVPMEIEFMREAGKKVAVVGNREWSFALKAKGIRLFSGSDGIKNAVAWLTD